MVKVFHGLKPLFIESELKSALGYPVTSQIEEKIRKIVEEMKPVVEGLIEPKGIYCQVKINIENESVVITSEDKNYSFTSKKLARRLKNCTEAFIFAVTIGNRVEELSAELMRSGDYAKALVVDALGSTYAEGLAEAAQQYLKVNELEDPEKEKLVDRYSPGYGDLDLSVQKIIFEILKPSEIGLTLNESMIMTPRKSVTAIVGKEKKYCCDS